MPRRVEKYPEGGAWLVLVLGRAEFEHGRLGDVEIIDDHVEVHLLWYLLTRPAQRSGLPVTASRPLIEYLFDLMFEVETLVEILDQSWTGRLPGEQLRWGPCPSPGGSQPGGAGVHPLFTLLGERAVLP